MSKEDFNLDKDIQLPKWDYRQVPINRDNILLETRLDASIADLKVLVEFLDPDSSLYKSIDFLDSSNNDLKNGLYIVEEDPGPRAFETEKNFRMGNGRNVPARTPPKLDENVLGYAQIIQTYKNRSKPIDVKIASLHADSRPVWLFFRDYLLSNFPVKGKGGPPETPEIRQLKIVNGWLEFKDAKSDVRFNRQEKYCNKVGVNPRTLQRWMRKFKAEGKIKP